MQLLSIAANWNLHPSFHCRYSPCNSAPQLNSFLNKQFCAFLPSGKTWSPCANPPLRSNTFLPNKVLFVSKPAGSRRGTGVATPGGHTPARRPSPLVRKFLHWSPPAVPMVTKWHRASHWLCSAGSRPGRSFPATFIAKQLHCTEQLVGLVWGDSANFSSAEFC